MRADSDNISCSVDHEEHDWQSAYIYLVDPYSAESSIADHNTLSLDSFGQLVSM